MSLSWSRCNECVFLRRSQHLLDKMAIAGSLPLNWWSVCTCTCRTYTDNMMSHTLLVTRKHTLQVENIPAHNTQSLAWRTAHSRQDGWCIQTESNHQVEPIYETQGSQTLYYGSMGTHARDCTMWKLWMKLILTIPNRLQQHIVHVHSCHLRSQWGFTHPA